MDEEKNILDTVAEEVGQTFDVRIEDNVMLITPAEAGVAMFGVFETRAAQEDAAWAEVDRISTVLEQVRDDNAALRDLFEEVHATVLSFGFEDLATRMLQVAYPIRQVEVGE